MLPSQLNPLYWNWANMKPKIPTVWIVEVMNNRTGSCYISQRFQKSVELRIVIYCEKCKYLVLHANLIYCSGSTLLIRHEWAAQQEERILWCKCWGLFMTLLRMTMVHLQHVCTEHLDLNQVNVKEVMIYALCYCYVIIIVLLLFHREDMMCYLCYHKCNKWI